MIYVEPGSLSGRLRAPASKSHAQRLLLAASLAKGESRILNPGRCQDVVACLRVIQGLGAEIISEGKNLRIRGGQRPSETVLDCGESGFCLRAASALAALSHHPHTLSGHGTLLMRPVDMVLEPLRALGAHCESSSSRPPIQIKGPLKGGRAHVDGSASSQALSGLLLALPLAPFDSELSLESLQSAPYVRMTLDVLQDFGIRVEASPDFKRFQIPGGQAYRPGVHAVEGDWSGAAFLLAAGVLACDVDGCLRLEGLKPDSSQGDRRILEALNSAGADPRWEGDCLRVQRTELKGFEFDATDCPDLFPPLAALACHAKGTSRIHGVSRLRNKESDRASMLVSELGALGGKLNIRENALEITGTRMIGGTVHAHGDHRIALCCALAALRSAQGVTILGETCVAKSYPDFFKDLAQIRIHLQETASTDK